MIHPMLVDGEWVETASTISVVNPESGEEVGHVPAASAADVRRGVAAARRALGQPLPGHERTRVLAGAADLLEAMHERAAELIATEGIKTIRESRSEVTRAILTLRLSAEEASRANGRTLSLDRHRSGSGRFGFTVREPMGIIGAITPFNDPLNLVAHKVGPALASGNAVLLKPDSKTPLSALLLARALQESGLPKGWLQVLTGRGSVVGAAIVAHEDVTMISFTGGVEAGRAIHERAGMKPVSMELGANNPVIVHSDAHLELAMDRIASGAFSAAGQNCLHVQRVLAHRDVYDEVVDGLRERALSLRLGAKFDEATDMGPLIDSSALARTEQLLANAVGNGAEIVCGGAAVGSTFQPTLLTSVRADSLVHTEEAYAPLTTVSPYATLEEAIEQSNESRYGLAAAIFTASIDVAFRAASGLVAGQVMINESTDFRNDAMPFGGRRSSGIGREGVQSAVEAMTQPKVVAFNGIATLGLG